MTKDEGRYELSLLWDNNKDGHVICIERINELLIWYDPQTGQKGDRLFLNDETDYLDNIKKYCISIRRIDDKLVNRKMFSRLVKKI